MLLPSGNVVTKNQPIYSGSNFTWGEATKNCTRYIQALIINGKLIISDKQIEQNIIATAKKLDKVRQTLGDRPLHVNSWYRPQHINQKVGGSKYSRHQYGDAVDIRSNYYAPGIIYRLLDRIHPHGGLGKYYNFTHIDWRGRKARW